MTTIAETATIDKRAKIGLDVTIAPGCVISPGAVIGDRCELKANVFIGPGVNMGRENRIFQNCVLGEEPQMLSQGKGFSLIIGDHNVFRENSTVNSSTEVEGKTLIGHRCYLMAGVHIGHDCEIADQVVISNATQLSGFVHVKKKAWLGSLCGFHQFTTVGQYAYIGGMSAINRDVPPFVRVAGNYPFGVHGINSVGLQRAGFSKESIQAIHKAYLKLYKRRRDKVFSQALSELMEQGDMDASVREFVEALHRSSQHHLGRYRELSR
jgi:UDP-N-acetylglucosamine acyltransferase